MNIQQLLDTGMKMQKTPREFLGLANTIKLRVTAAMVFLCVCRCISADFQETLRKAEQGDASAQFDLGIAYHHGIGVEIDETQAVKWYRKAVEQGDTFAGVALARMYLQGKGVDKDEAEAIKLYRRAAEQGNVLAQGILGYVYQRGMHGAKEDAVESVRWYRKAAEQGSSQSQLQLGECYWSGTGVNKDELEALAWFYLAQQGWKRTLRQIELLEEKGGQEFVTLAKKRADELGATIEKRGTPGQNTATGRIP